MLLDASIYTQSLNAFVTFPNRYHKPHFIDKEIKA